MKTYKELWMRDPKGSIYQVAWLVLNGRVQGCVVRNAKGPVEMFGINKDVIRLLQEVA